MNAIGLLALICGVQFAYAEFKIFNGQTYDDWKDAPFHFLVHLSGSTTCTETWLGNKHILTAAHCVCRKDSALKRAVFERVKSHEFDKEQITIKTHYYNEDYKGCYSEDPFVFVNGFDSAIIEIAHNPEKSVHETVGLVTLTYRPNIDDVLTMAGYGIDKGGDTGHYRTGKAVVVECTGKFQNKPICLHPKKIYEARRIQGGDSGGPLIDENNKNTVVGTVSGHMIFKSKYYMMYASTMENKKFLEKYL